MFYTQSCPELHDFLYATVVTPGDDSTNLTNDNEVYKFVDTALGIGRVASPKLGRLYPR